MSGELSYLWHLCAWAGPVLVFQAVALWWTSPVPARTVMRAALVPVVAVSGWLVAADQLAISAGIWRFGEDKILGLRLGAVPIEEVLFFLTTNTLVAGGTILLDGLGRGRPRR